MSLFKKFADFCAGLALFVAAFFLLRHFLAFAPDGDPSLIEKAKLFLGQTAWRDYRPTLDLVGLLALSLLVGIVLRRLPSVCFAFATLPFLQSLAMYRDGYLYERPMLYLLLTALPLAGNLYDALHRDRLDGRHRAFRLANLSSLLVLGFLVLVIWRAKVTADTPVYDLKRFDQEIFFVADSTDFSVWKPLALMYGIGIAVSLLFCGAYWLDLLLALPPLGYALSLQTMGTLGPHNELLLALMVLCLVCRLSVMIAGTPWASKRKKEVLKNTERNDEN